MPRTNLAGINREARATSNNRSHRDLFGGKGTSSLWKNYLASPSDKSDGFINTKPKGFRFTEGVDFR
jgi:hypothetical protein